MGDHQDENKFMNTKILVTGASGGTQGSTGNKLTRSLLLAGYPVLAFVRKEDERSEELKKLGAEIFVGNMLDKKAVVEAVSKVEKVYFCFPVGPGLLEASAIMAFAAMEAKTKLIVNLSQGSASPKSPSATSRMHWLSEQIFKASKVPTIHLRGGIFFENIFRQFAKGISTDDEMRAPFGDGSGLLPLVAAEDIASSAHALLTGPPRLRTIYPIFGEVISLKELARETSEKLGREIQYRKVSDEQWLDEAKGREDLANDEQFNHLINLWKHILFANRKAWFRYGLPFLPDAVQGLTGKKSISLKQWLSSNSANDLGIAPG